MEENKEDPLSALNIQALVQQKLESLKQQLPSHLADLATIRPEDLEQNQHQDQVQDPEPNQVQQAALKTMRSRRAQRKRPAQVTQDSSSSTDEIDEADLALGDSEQQSDDLYENQLQNEDQLDFDTVCKEITKLPVESLDLKNYFYNAPFLVIYTPGAQQQGQTELTQNNFHQVLNIPRQSELMQLYEDFYTQKLPQKSINLIKSQFFITKYCPEILHAVDGLGSGVVILPIKGNMIVQVYKTREHSFQEIAGPLLQLQSKLLLQ